MQALLPMGFSDLAGTSGYGFGAADADQETQIIELNRLANEQRMRGAADASEYYDAESHERSPLVGSRRHPGDRSADTVILTNYLSKPSLPLPLIIIHQLALYLASCKSKGKLESIGPAGYNAMAGALQQLSTDFTTLDRLASIGIPTVYGVHLKQCESTLSPC